MKIHWFFKVLMICGVVVFLGLSFYFGLPRVLPVQYLKNTQVYGLILSDQVWEGQIKIVGDIYSPVNTKITILPGTDVKIAVKGDKSNMDFLPWHKKNGINTGPYSHGIASGEPFWDEGEKIQIHLNNLQVLGNSTRPVSIGADSDDPSAYHFNLISIRSGYINNARMSNYRRFEAGGNTIIANSKFSDTGECSICLYMGKPKIYSNFFKDSLKESIWVDRASPDIANNIFQNLKGDGIRIDARRLSSPQITGNIFEMPQRTVIDIISGGQFEEGLIARNFFAGNTRIKIACDTLIKIRDNIILGQISFSNGCDGRFIFGPNYWGTPDPGIILKEKILNKYDTFSIELPNVLLSPPKDVGRN